MKIKSKNMKKLFMMNYRVIVMLFSVTLFACSNSQKEEELSIKIDKLQEEIESFKEQGLSGTYIGDFGDNMINITLVDCIDGIVTGYSVCAGNDRDMQGKYSINEDGSFYFELDEPGDNKYDGSFKFNLYVQNQTIQGSWDPYKDIVKSKNYLLKKRQYQYNVNNGDYSYVSQRYLNQEELLGFDLDELGEMRNEIYARYGYSFKNKSWRDYFEKQDWYIPTRLDIRDKITKVETKNIALIKDLEEYWDIGYDDFGR